MLPIRKYPESALVLLSSVFQAPPSWAGLAIVKLLHATKDAENSFHHCGGLPDPVCVSGRSLKACVNLVQASLGVKKGLESKCQHPCESL